MRYRYKKKPRNKDQERMFYIRSLQNQIVADLFAHQKKEFERVMWDIAEENQTLLGTRTNTFMWDGQWYPIPNPPKDCNKTLHPTLRAKVYKLMSAVNPHDADMEAGINTLIANALTTARNHFDLDRLLPSKAMEMVSYIDPAVFNIGASLSDDEVDAFKETNKINLKYLKRTIMLQLLLQQ